MFIAITRDRRDRGGPQTYHVQVRLFVAGQPVLQSRKLPTPTNAQREAERIFGPLEWMTAEQAGLDNQPFVVQVAEFRLGAGGTE
jgi:hypothetical protein